MTDLLPEQVEAVADTLKCVFVVVHNPSSDEWRKIAALAIEAYEATRTPPDDVEKLVNRLRSRADTLERLGRENRPLTTEGDVALCVLTREHLRDAAAVIERQAAALQASDNRLVDALEEIKQRCEAYPESVFSEPDLEAVATVLKQAGMLEQMDRMHASWARKILADQGEIAAAALKDIGR